MSDSTAGSLDTFLANATLFYQKLRHYHWNVQGRDFFDLHARFEMIYEKWAPHIDQVAERIIALDEVPVHTLAGMLERATLAEDDGIPDGGEMVQRTLADMEALRAAAATIVAEAEAAGDRTTVNLLDAIGDDIEGDVWMLKAWQKRR